jgi:hypothetical protein
MPFLLKFDAIFQTLPQKGKILPTFQNITQSDN